MNLSKSRFIASIQRLKSMYWQVHSPELCAEPDDSGAAILDQGLEAGRLRTKLSRAGCKWKPSEIRARLRIVLSR
jgi:hypothetical protein